MAAFKKVLAENFLFVRLLERSERDNIAEIQNEVVAAYQSINRPLYYFIIVGERIPAPTPEGRRLIGESLTFMNSMCDSFHIILEGKGAFSGLKRMVSAGLMLLSPMGKKTFVHESIEAGVRNIAKKTGRNIEQVLKIALAHGIFEDR